MTPPQPQKNDDERPIVFYADPVDEDGNVIANARLTITASRWGPIVPFKVPASEITTDPENTIAIDLADFDEGPESVA